jgi:hypothetical protein
MLQKLENIYLGILRGVVLIISGGLLLGAIVFGINALKVIGGPPTFDPYTPSIEFKIEYKQSLIEQYQSQKSTQDGLINDNAADSAYPTFQEAEPEDPNQAHYEAVANFIDEFVTEVSGEPGGVNVDFVINHVRSRAEAYNSYRHTNAYASDVVSSVRAVLEDESIIAVANNQNMFDIVNDVLDDFDRQFDQALDAEDRRRSQAQRQHAQDKMDGIQSLYVAGGTFGAFLLIVFLSIFIKIERNLRHLTDLPKGRNKTT